MDFNDIAALVFAAVLILAGAVWLACAVYQRFLRKPEPDPRRWQKTTAVVTGEFTYTERISHSNHRQLVPTEVTEPTIMYEADGKTYEKSVPYADESGKITIYYKRSDPSFFRTEGEIESAYQSGKSVGGFIFSLLMSLAVMGFGAAMAAAIIIH